MACAGSSGGLLYHLPDSLAELEIFHILCEIVQATKQVERVAKHREGCPTKGSCHAKPLLLTNPDQYTIRCFLNSHRQGGLATGSRAGPSSDLDSHAIALSQGLCS